MPPDDILSQLVTMSNHLGDPANDYVILGEGNTSAQADGETFWVKASGTQLRTIGKDGFVRVRFDRLLALLDKDSVGDAEVEAAMEAAKVHKAITLRPSVEAVLHALALQLDGVNFVGHTHPVAINALTCSVVFEAAVSGHIFPDEIVVCGVAPVIVPYTDPGIPLARKVRDLLHAYIDDYGELPKVVLMQNHGLIALGRTAQLVENITAMAVKWARILLGTYALGGPNFLTPAQVDRIHTRPDELYRRRQLGE